MSNESGSSNKRFSNFKVVHLILTALLALETAGVGLAAENQSTSRVMYAFWPYWTDPSSYRPDWSVLTHVAYHSWEANKYGMLIPPKDINRFNTVKNISHQNNVKMIISVKSFDKNTLDSIFAYHKDELAKNILSALQNYGADGVILDFEYPRNKNSYTGASNTELFEDLMLTIYTKVKSQNPDYYISITVAGEIEEVFRNAALSKYTDSVILRGYNYHSLNSSSTGAPSPYNRVIDSVNLAKKYYPSDKIILGLYFSGYDWPSSLGEQGSSTTGSGIAVPMKKAISDSLVYGRLWDSDSRTPWYKYQIGNTWHQTWYDDDQSLGLKLDFINSENIRGAGFWALGYEGNNATIWNIVREKSLMRYFVTETPATAPTDFHNITYVNSTETPKVPGFELMNSICGSLAWVLYSGRNVLK